MTTIKVLYTSTEIIREKFIENTVVTVARLSIGSVCFAEVDGVFFLVSGIFRSVLCIIVLCFLDRLW